MQDTGKQRQLSEEEDRERIRGQIEIVVSALGGPERVGWWSPDGRDPADFVYLYRRGHILVRDESLDRVRRVLSDLQRRQDVAQQEATGGEPADNLIDGVTLLSLPSGLDAPEALDRIDAEVGAGAASPDHVLYVTRGSAGCCPAVEPDVPGGTEPDPPISGNAADGSGVLVSVVDTGWHSPAAEHPDTPWLQGVTGDEESIDPNAIHPYAGHGTFIAGIVRCVAPAAQVRVEGFLPNGGAVFESEIVVQLYQTLRLGPDIISLSAGAHSRNHQPLLGFDAFWRTGLRHLKGTVLVAAAGNDGDRIPFWPAAFPWSVSVGALRRRRRKRATFSNYGSWVDVYAKGVDLINAFPKGEFTCQEPPNKGQVRTFSGLASWSGTSFSTPTVAGIIAARMSHTGESAREAADALLGLSRQNAITGLGGVLTPGPHNLR